MYEENPFKIFLEKFEEKILTKTKKEIYLNASLITSTSLAVNILEGNLSLNEKEIHFINNFEKMYELMNYINDACYDFNNSDSFVIEDFYEYLNR